MSKLTDLNEFDMCDGVSWTAEGPRGRLWTIVWQPGRAEDNIRAWPFPAGRTAHRDCAETVEDARVLALKIAEKIKLGR